MNIYASDFLFGLSSQDLTQQQLTKILLPKLAKLCVSDDRAVIAIADKFKNDSVTMEEAREFASTDEVHIEYLAFTSPNRDVLIESYNYWLDKNKDNIIRDMGSYRYYTYKNPYIYCLLNNDNKIVALKHYSDQERQEYLTGIAVPHKYIDLYWAAKHEIDLDKLLAHIGTHNLEEIFRRTDLVSLSTEYPKAMLMIKNSIMGFRQARFFKAFFDNASKEDSDDLARRLINSDTSDAHPQFVLLYKHADSESITAALRCLAKYKPKIGSIYSPLKPSHFSPLPPVMRFEAIFNMVDQRMLEQEALNELASTEEFKGFMFAVVFRHRTRVDELIRRIRYFTNNPNLLKEEENANGAS